MTSEPQRQLPTETSDAVSAHIAASEEASDLTFQDAIEALREGIDGYGDRVHATAEVLRAVDDLGVPNNILTHPRVEQGIWRYSHDADTVRREIEITIEREADDDVTVDEIVAAYRVAAARLDTPIDVD
ncbi:MULTISPECIES: hypothetical protein [Halobacteriales]|jgi:hypothetical protein|uniref:hypothetical protein n=1 Tax=Halobacteriales TaxID=2235 RepID=UPI000F4CA3E8|nr:MULTISPECIES: hypothetical protein [Halobacteria]MDT3436730.1 hypothetical protein [Haloarcula sp. 1CSR25-25]